MSIKPFLKANFILLVAIGIVAITSAFKAHYDTDTYIYRGPASFTIGDLETESNWKLSGTPTALSCNEITEVNCTIQLPTDLDNGSGELDDMKAEVQANLVGSFNIVQEVHDLTQPSEPDVLGNKTYGQKPPPEE
ncbi:MAG TPA: hypothetical protein PKE30_00270 [Niabella sp.]|nr:hypothetical protein [Niabella sp.]